MRKCIGLNEFSLLLLAAQFVPTPGMELSALAQTSAPTAGTSQFFSALPVAPPGGLVPRTLGNRAADVFNWKDFGASGNGTLTPVGTTYGTTPSAWSAYVAPDGSTPLSWATNAAYGLQFSMPVSLTGSAGNGLLFFSTRHTCDTGGACWNGLMSLWSDPSNRNYLVAPGMQVTSSANCLAANTVVAPNPAMTVTGSLLNPLTWGVAAIPVRQQELLPANGSVPAETDYMAGATYAMGARVAANGGHWMATSITNGKTATATAAQTLAGFPASVLNKGALNVTVSGTTMVVASASPAFTGDNASVFSNQPLPLSVQFWVPGSTGLVAGGPYTITSYNGNASFTLSSSPGALPAGTLAIVPGSSVAVSGPTYPGSFGLPWSSSYVGTQFTDGGVTWTLEGREDVKMLPTGLINLSPQPASACAAGASFQFTESPSQLEALSTDYVAAQTATALATSHVQGGESFAPAGQYELNHTLIIPALVTNTNTNTPTTVVRGAGANLTSIHTTLDLGWDKFAIVESYQGTDQPLAEALYEQFSLVNEQPGISASVQGTRSINMRGLGMGKFDRANHLTIQGYASGLVEQKDHQLVDNMNITNNACDVDMGEYNDTIGNQVWSASGIGGGQTASVCISGSAAIDSAGFYEVHSGGAPRSIYTLPDWPNVTVDFPEVVGGSDLVNMWMENIGQEFEYSNNRPFGNNRIIGGGVPGIGSPGTAILNVGVSGSPAISPKAVFYNGAASGTNLNGTFGSNTLIGTTMGAAFNPIPGSNQVTDGIFESSGGGGNMIVNDPGLITGGTLQLPAFAGPISQQYPSNTWQTPLGQGYFGVYSGFGQNLSSGEPVKYVDSGLFVAGYTDGAAVAGLTVAPCAGNSYEQCAIQVSGVVQNVLNVSNTPISASSTVAATNNGGASSPGIIPVITGQGSIGFAISGASGGATATIMLTPTAQGGAPGSATGLTATTPTTAGGCAGGYQIASQLSSFSTVPANGVAILALIPNGASETIHNGGANMIAICAPGANTPLSPSLGTGTTATFHNYSGTYQ